MLDFKVFVQGQFYAPGQEVHVEVGPNGQVNLGVFATNISDSRYEVVYIELTPQPVNEPLPETVVPGWAFVSTSHFGDVGYPGLDPQVGIGGNAIYEVGGNGSIKHVRAEAYAFRLYGTPDGQVTPDYYEMIDVYYHAVSPAGGGDENPPSGDEQPPPVPTSEKSNLWPVAIGAGILVLAAINDRDKK